MKKKAVSILTVAILTMAMLAGCGQKAEETAAASAAETEETADAQDGETGDADGDGTQEVITLRSAFAVGMTGAVNNFAIEKGLYEAEGILFDNTPANSADERLSLMSRGDIDVVDGDPGTYIPGICNGVEAKLVGNMWRYAGCYWLIANNDIQSFEDLKGKTIGVAQAAGGLKLSVLQMLEANGISQDEVELVANGTNQEAYATFTSGEVDATIIHNPYAVLAEEEGIGHPLGRAWDYIPDYYTGTLMASNDMIENHPEELQRFVTAYYKVHEEVKNEYFDEFVTWLAESMNQSEDTIRKAIESEIDVWTDYPVIPEDRIERTVEIMKEYGWMDENVETEGTYTNEFAEKAAEELGLTDPEAE